MTTRKFYKTSITVEVLSEEYLDSGQVTKTTMKELNGRQAAKALTRQASSPEFFNLTPDGEDWEQ